MRLISAMTLLQAGIIFLMPPLLVAQVNNEAAAKVKAPNADAIPGSSRIPVRMRSC